MDRLKKIYDFILKEIISIESICVPILFNLDGLRKRQDREI